MAESVWEYPETALREALVNALAHRDLFLAARGGQVQIEMYPDRLVIRNPGGLYGALTVDDLGEEGVSSARNATLMRLLEDVPVPGETRTVCENRGSGIRAMLDALGRETLSRAELSSRTGLGDQIVRRWLRVLREENVIETVGGSTADRTSDTAAPSRIRSPPRAVERRGIQTRAVGRLWQRQHRRQPGTACAGDEEARRLPHPLHGCPPQSRHERMSSGGVLPKRGPSRHTM
ncbi:hypothetical protein J5X84_33680 [Streptosporangiaceae bacterium NEAU-GS5]|nr:hypothetical protein [Streptosporangiaceae bacterium NEAU-GS5]